MFMKLKKTTKKFPICFKCKNLYRGRRNDNGSFTPIFKCEAFQERIPFDILESIFIHTALYPGQSNEIVFEKI